jgi:hypothetical protein
VIGLSGKASRSNLRRLLHDFDNRVLHFLCHFFQLWRVEHRQQSGRLQTSQNGFTALISIGFPSWLAPVLLLGCPCSLDHVIELRSSNAFFNEPFIIAPPLVILIVAGRHWHFMSSQAWHRVPAFGFGR